MLKRTSIAVITVCVLSLAGIAVFGFSRDPETGDRFRTATVDRGDIQRSVSASGELKAVVTVKVGSEISGQISELFADFNSEVTAGQVIARIDPESFEARVQQAEAELAVARAMVGIRKASLAQARANLQNARERLVAEEANLQRTRVTAKDLEQDYGRKRQLHKRDVVAVSMVDKARSAWEAAVQNEAAAAAQKRAQESTVSARTAQVAMAEAEVVHAGAQVQQKAATVALARVNLENTFIRSPVDGVVIGRDVDVGQTVAASLQAPVLFTIARDLREMQVETNIDEADIGQVRTGQLATFSVDSFPRLRFEGRVTQIRKQPRTVQNVVTYSVVLTADNADQKLLPGMTANVEITVSRRSGVLRVPNAALRFTPPGQETAGAARSPAGFRSGNAPSGAGRSARGEARLKQLATTLGLDEQQQSEIRELRRAMFQRIRSLRQNGIRGDEFRQSVRQLRRQAAEQTMSVLNPSQRVAYEALLSERRSNPARSARVWTDVGGKPKAVDVLVGVSDGRFTEMVRGDLNEGQEVLTGIIAPAKEQKSLFPRFGL